MGDRSVTLLGTSQEVLIQDGEWGNRVLFEWPCGEGHSVDPERLIKLLEGMLATFELIPVADLVVPLADLDVDGFALRMRSPSTVEVVSADYISDEFGELDIAHVLRSLRELLKERENAARAGKTS